VTFLRHSVYLDKYKNVTVQKSLQRRHGLHHTTKTAKNQKCGITFAAHRHNVNVLRSNSTYLMKL